MLFQIEDFPLNISDCNVKFPGLKPVNEWKAYQLKDKPGEVEFIFFPMFEASGFQIRVCN